MADETIRIDYITTYIEHGHAEALRDHDRFNEKLKQSGIINKRGQASLKAYRDELAKTHPHIKRLTDDLDKLHKVEAQGGSLTEQQIKDRDRIQKELTKELRVLRTVATERARAEAAERKASRERLKNLRAERAEEERAHRAEAARLREVESLRTAAANREAAEIKARMAAHRERTQQIKEEEKLERDHDAAQMAAIENLVSKIQNLDNAFDHNRKRQSLWSRQMDNLTLRSTRRAISGVHEWTTTLASIALPAVPQFLSLLVGALGTVGAAAVGAAASLAKLAPGIGAVGLAVTGVVQAMGTWKLAMRDFGGASGLFQSAMFDDMDTFLKKVEKVTPAAQLFAVTLRSKMRPAIETFQRTAQRGIFSGLNVAMDALLPRRGLVNNIIGQTSQAMGGVIGNLGKELARPEWASAFKDIGSNNARWIGELGNAAIPTARALRDLTVAATPIMDWAVKGTTRLSNMFEQFVKGKKATGELARGVEGARKRLEDFADIAGSTGGALMSVLKAGQPLGDMITTGLRDQANAAQQWSRSFEGQRRMSEWFVHMQPAVVESGKLVKDLAMSMGRVAEQSSIEVLVHQLRADLLPTLEQTMIATNRSMGPLLVETVVNVLQAFTTATGPNGPVTMMIQGINQLAQAFQKLNELFPDLKKLIGVFAMFRVLRLTGALVGGRAVFEMIQGARARQATQLQRATLQEQLMPFVRQQHPQAFVRETKYGRNWGRMMLDPTLIPEGDPMREIMMRQEPTFAQRLFTKEGRAEMRGTFRDFRAQGMSPLLAGPRAFMPRGVMGAAGGVGLMLGGQMAGQAAGAAGASGRVQSVVGMAGMGAGIGAMMASPTGVGIPVGAAVGAVVGGLAGLGMSFLGAKEKVDKFTGAMEAATTGVAVARDARQRIRMNQRQLQLGVRGAQLEYRSAVAARDALGRGMTGPEFEKFTKTDVYKQAQLRVDTARTNLQDLKTALQQNTEQLKIANAMVKQRERQPRQFLQKQAGVLGGRLLETNRQIRDIEQGGVTDSERFSYRMLLAKRNKALQEFARNMTKASQNAAERSMPYWSRMFKAAISEAVAQGGAGPGFYGNVQRRARGQNTAPVRPDDRATRRAMGGRITWGSPSSDSSPALLSRGEFVVTGGGEQMLENMTFPGVLNWLEGAQPPHFAQGGRMTDMPTRRRSNFSVAGRGDMVDRRRNDPGRLPVPSNLLMRERDAPFFWDPWIALLQGKEANQTPTIFSSNSGLGKLQRAMGVRGYADGGFVRNAILAPFLSSFSSGFSAGEGRESNAIASLYSSVVGSGVFAAIQKATGDGSGKRKKTPKGGGMAAAAPAKAKALYNQMPSLTAVPFVQGGGHAARPGASGPDVAAIRAQYPGMDAAAARVAAEAAAKERGTKRGFDSPGWVRWALYKGGFGDVGRAPQSLQGFGRPTRGDYMSVLATYPRAERAFLELGSTWFGQVGVGQHKRFGSKSRTSLGNFRAYSRPGFRRGGRVGPRRFATGGRVTGVPVPAVTGTGGDAANKAWANNVMSFLQGLTNATLGGIASAVAGLQERVIALTQRADTSEAGQNLLARVSALLDAAEFALGERLGRMQDVINRMGEETGKQRGRLERMLAIREIDPGSPRGLAQNLMQLRRENTGRFGLRNQIRAQRDLVRQAAGTPEEQQLQQRLDELIQQAVDNSLQRILTRRELQRARDLKPFTMAANTGERNQFELQRLTLNQQLRGVTGDAASAQLSSFMKTTMLPNLRAQEKAANRAMVREKQRGGGRTDTAAYLEARQRWEQAVLDRLGLQVQLAQEGNQTQAEMSRRLAGQLSFDFMGERTTDLLATGTGI